VPWCYEAVPPEDGCLLDVDPDGEPLGDDVEVAEFEGVGVDVDGLDEGADVEVGGHGDELDDADAEEEEEEEDPEGHGDELDGVDGDEDGGLLGGGTSWSAPPVPPVGRANQLPLSGS
jgi:hypothetical protein